ncbi:MAG: SlyX family protein [Ferrimonas sp.]
MIEQRLVDLEMKVAYQEATIEQLNEAVIELNNRLAQQTEKLKLLAERVKSMPLASNQEENDNAPPPHY